MKNDAWATLERELLVAFLILSLLLFACGLGTGLTWGKTGWSVAIISGAVTLAVGIGYVVFRKLEARWELAGKERIKRLSGAHAEALIAHVLKTQLLDDSDGLRRTGGWHIWSNVPLGDLGDADQVVVGPGGCFVVSVKSQLGLLQVGGNALLLNNRPTPEPWAADVVKQALRLRDRINATDGKAAPFVRGVLCVPHAALEPHVTPLWCGNALICNERTLIETLERHGNPLDRSSVLRLKDAIGTLCGANPPGEKSGESQT